MLRKMIVLFCFLNSALWAEEFQLNSDRVHGLGDASSWRRRFELAAPPNEAKTPCSSPEWKDASLSPTDDEAMSEYVTYCRLFEVSAKPVGPIAFDLGVINNTDQLYLNGLLIGRTGHIDDAGPQAYDRRRIYTVDSSFFREGRNVLVVQVRRYWLTNPALSIENVVFGPSSIVERNLMSENYRRSFFLAVYATTAGYFLFLFFFRRHEKENLYFALFVISLIIYQLLRTQMKYDYFETFLYMQKAEFFMVATLAPFLYLFIQAYFPLASPRALKITRGLAALGITLSALTALITLFTSEPRTWSLATNSLYVVAGGPLLCGLAVYHLGHHALRRNRDALLMTTGFALMLATTFVDALTALNVWHLPFITGYTFFLLILNIAVILSHRFVRLHSAVEDLNQNLEKKVEERTDELNYSLKQLQILKEKQDGDYFLTSLLIQPLAGVGPQVGSVSLAARTRQKKAFQFRNKNIEIGGDISIGDRVLLRNKPYTAFINADAMGKSIQGAGGALVVGTVFRALLGRTKTLEVFKQRSPEQWMKDAYREIQDVFCAFDGSMLASAFFGLLDEATGVLYYINAEHPRAVIYRNGVASFFEKDDLFYKFGIDTFQPPFQVSIFRLLPGDVLMLGTDGRDDLILKSDDNLSINDDMDRFLHHVQYAEGDLDITLDSLQESGLLTDDISLLRVGYRESESASSPPNVGLRERALHCFNEHDYASSLVLFEQVLEEDPSDTHALFSLAVARRKLAQKRSDLTLAVDAGERVRMRLPTHRDNLRNLVKCYEALGNPKAKALREKLAAQEAP